MPRTLKQQVPHPVYMAAAGKLGHLTRSDLALLPVSSICWRVCTIVGAAVTLIIF